MPTLSSKSTAISGLTKTTVAVAIATTVLFSSGITHADSLPELQTLAKQGQRQQALDRTNKMLAINPKDPQLRFFKGVILSELNRSTEALAVFQKLTEDYPEFPEPYNNIAVIYAQQNNYDKSRQALESAIRTHPSYATAHENLGDVYARLASQAYSKAFSLDTSKVAARNKLAMIRELMSTSDRTAGVAPPAAAPAVAARPVPAAVPEAPAATPVATIAAAPATAKAAPVTASRAAPATPDQGNATTTLTQLTQAWAQAWSSKDLVAYLGMYSPDFKPSSKFGTIKAWKADRTRIFKRPGAVQVVLKDVKVSLAGTRAQVSFTQEYTSVSFSDVTNKTLTYVQQDGTWLIQKEELDR